MSDKFTQRFESPTLTSLRTIEATRLKDGAVEILVDESTKKFSGKRWSSRAVGITLTREQFQQLIEQTT